MRGNQGAKGHRLIGSSDRAAWTPSARGSRHLSQTRGSLERASASADTRLGIVTRTSPSRSSSHLALTSVSAMT